VGLDKRQGTLHKVVQHGDFGLGKPPNHGRPDNADGKRSNHAYNDIRVVHHHSAYTGADYGYSDHHTDANQGPIGITVPAIRLRDTITYHRRCDHHHCSRPGNLLLPETEETSRRRYNGPSSVE